MSDEAASGARPFAHLGTENADVYRAVLTVFARARRRYTLHLRPEDVQAGLAESGTGTTADPAAVEDALTPLVRWGNLRADPDTGRVTNVADFHRARYLYQLTPAGQAAERALQVYEEALGRRGSLQAVALGDVAEHLRALVVLLQAQDPAGPGGGPVAEPDAARAAHLLTALTGRLESLAENASAFMSAMQRTIDLHDADVAAFLAYKDRLIDYLERFLSDLVTTGAEISGLVEQAEAAGVHPLLAAVAEREAADLAPADGAQAQASREQEVALVHDAWAQRWRGVHEWFVGSRETPSQKDLLRRRGRAAVPQLLRAVSVLNERRSGRSDRSADFRRLALWFAQAPDDASRHRLWRSAFALSPARHLGIDGDTLSAREAEPARTALPWAQAEPLRISPQFRRTGHHERRGRPARVVDRTAQRRHLHQLAADETAELLAARAQLLTPGPVRLSDLPELDGPAFSLFLALLGRAVAARRPGKALGTSEATSADGSLRVRLTGLPDAPVVAVQTEHGTLHLRDSLVSVEEVPGAVSGEVGTP